MKEITLSESNAPASPAELQASENLLVSIAKGEKPETRITATDGKIELLFVGIGVRVLYDVQNFGSFLQMGHKALAQAREQTAQQKRPAPPNPKPSGPLKSVTKRPR